MSIGFVILNTYMHVFSGLFLGPTNFSLKVINEDFGRVEFKWSLVQQFDNNIISLYCTLENSFLIVFSEVYSSSVSSALVILKLSTTHTCYISGRIGNSYGPSENIMFTTST